MEKMSRSEAGKLGSLKSKAQHEAAYQSRVEAYNLNPKRCSNCEIPLPYEKRINNFCGHSCAASKRNFGKVRNFTTGEFAKKSCAWCGQETRNSKFCSHACNKKHDWNKRKEEIEATGMVESPTVSKRYVTERDGYCCRVCGISEWKDNPLSLVLDHINGNPEDWSLDNLRLLCPNCDSQTPTYKGRNLGNGRHSRRQRYAEGKSY